MNPSPKLHAMPWDALILPPDYLHPLTFVRPDVVLHVHDLWQRGKHLERVHRGFALPDAVTHKPFVMMGLSPCIEFMRGWHIEDADADILRGIPSLRSLNDDFCAYLAKMRFTGDADGLPDGTVMGTVPMTLSPGIRKLYGDKPVPLDVITITSAAAEVALISEGLAAILDFAIQYSAKVFADQRNGQSPWFYLSEREIHPFWARLAAIIEYVLGAHNPLGSSPERIWLWVDDERDADMRRRAALAAPLLRRLGRDPLMLIRKTTHD